MKKSFFVIITAVSLLCSHAADIFFPLVKDHQAQSCILLPENASKEISEAIKNFNQALKTITGAQLPVAKKDTAGNRIVFSIRKVDFLMTMDNFTITFPDRRTMQIECGASAVQWAFNHIIREFAKAEWILQEECGLSYTPMKDLMIPAKKIEVKNISWGISRTYNLMNPHWRLNYQRRLTIDHTLTRQAFPWEKYSKNNSWPKAMMPVLNGKKITRVSSRANIWQPCYSNPETARIAAENLLEYLRRHPDTLGLSLGCNDNGGFCECAECLKMDHHGYSRSESYFTFINRVLKEVCKKYPKLLFSVFAYTQTYQPPSFKLHPNAVVYLTIDFNSCIDPKIQEKHKKIIAEWGKKASILGVWDYSWGHPYPAPRMYAPHYLDMLKFMTRHNAKAYYGECWVHDAFEGPKQYLISKLLWNSNQDMKKLEEDWYIRCVGKKAAPYLKAYYKVWNDYYTGRVRQTPWFKSASSVYMTYNDVSCIYGLQEKDYRAAEQAMKRVVELAETDQEKMRAALMMRHWQYIRIRLRLLGAGIYDPNGTISSRDQALRLLDTVIKSPEYIRQYERISNTLIQDKNLHKCYLYGYYLKVGGSPVRQNFDLAVNSHILAAFKFIDDPEVAGKMKQISESPSQPELIRQICKALSAPELQKNLLVGGDAESGVPADYGLHRDTIGKAVLSTSGDYKTGGKRSFMVTIKGHDAWFLFPIQAKPLHTYMATFKVFSPKPSAEGYMERNIYSYKDNRPQQYRLSPSLKLPGGVWQTFSVLTSTRADADGVKLQIRFRNFDRGDVIYIDDIRIMEIGATAVQPVKKTPAAGKTVMQPITLGSPEDFENPKAFVKDGNMLLVKGDGTWFSSKTFEVDPAKSYHFSLEYRNHSGSPAKILTGFVPLDKNGKIISAKKDSAYIWNPVLDHRRGAWNLRRSKLIGPSGKRDNPRYTVCPGMKAARLLLRVKGKADSVTEIRNVKVEEVK